VPYVVAGSRPSGRYVRGSAGGPLGYATLGTEWPRDVLFEPYPTRRRAVIWTASAAPAPPIIPIVRARIVRARKRAAWQVPAVRRARRDVAGAMAGRAGPGAALSGLTTWDIGGCCCGCAVCSPCPLPETNLHVTINGVLHALTYNGSCAWSTACFGSTIFKVACTGGCTYYVYEGHGGDPTCAGAYTGEEHYDFPHPCAPYPAANAIISLTSFTCSPLNITLTSPSFTYVITP
jgi:hypothetical protein